MDQNRFIDQTVTNYVQMVAMIPSDRSRRPPAELAGFAPPVSRESWGWDSRLGLGAGGLCRRGEDGIGW